MFFTYESRLLTILHTETMNSFTNDCEHVFHSVDSVHNHFIMDWKNAFTHFETFVDKEDIDNTVNELCDDNDADTDEEEEECEQNAQDFCIFQFEF